MEVPLLKTIKYTICFCVFFIGVLIIGESHIFHLDNFYTPYRYTTLYLQNGQDEQNMKKDTVEAADKHKVQVFTFIKTLKDNWTDIKIYGSPGVEEQISKDQNISSKEYKSLFLGNIKFSFYGIDNIPDLKDVHDFYIIGENQQAQAFKNELINKYAGNFPQEGYSNDDTRNTVIALWIMMISITLLLTYYDVVYQKKENLIRISMGEQITVLICKNIVRDSLVYLLMFAVIFFSLNKVTSISIDFEVSLLASLLLIVSNAAIYLNLYSYNLRETFSNGKSSSKKLLSLNYGLKLITVILTIFVISSNIVLVFESFHLYKQKSFFEEHANYSYINTIYRPVMGEDGQGDPKFNESERLQAELYNENFNKAILLSVIHKPLKTTAPAIMANRNAFTYLEDNIVELKQLTRNKKIYFILPQFLSKNEELLDNLKEEFSFYEGHAIEDDFGVVYYKEPVNLVAINGSLTYGSELVENPIIIYNNISPKPNQVTVEPNSANYIYEVMYDLSNEQFNEFVERHQLSETNAILFKKNILQKYNESWDIAKQILYVNFVFSILVLFLELIIITSIIKLEYEVNAIELSIKKVLGYSVWEKNRKIILMTLISSLLSIGISVTAAYLLKLNSIAYLTLGGGIILASEMIVILFYIRKIEKLKIQKILKGGNV